MTISETMHQTMSLYRWVHWKKWELPNLLPINRLEPWVCIKDICNFFLTSLKAALLDLCSAICIIESCPT